MAEETITTDVDRLINILREEGKLELSQLAKRINVSEDVVQQWVEFLVEEKIVSVDYNFTKPIVSIVENLEEKKEEKKDIKKYKKSFKEKSSKEKGNAEYLWKQHIIENVESMRVFFFEEARKRHLENAKELWEEYKAKVSTL